MLTLVSPINTTVGSFSGGSSSPGGVGMIRLGGGNNNGGSATGSSFGQQQPLPWSAPRGLVDDDDGDSTSGMVFGSRAAAEMSGGRRRHNAVAEPIDGGALLAALRSRGRNSERQQQPQQLAWRDIASPSNFGSNNWQQGGDSNTARGLRPTAPISFGGGGGGSAGGWGLGGVQTRSERRAERRAERREERQERRAERRGR